MELPVVDAEEDALRQLGRETDMAEGRVDDSESAQQSAQVAPPIEEPPVNPQPTPERKPDDSGPEPELPPPSEERQRDDKGRFKGQEPAQQENGEQAPSVEKPVQQQSERGKSSYAQARERAQKEAERKERNWTEIHQERERARAEIEAERQKLRGEQLQSQAQARPLEKGGIDIQGYQRAYQDFRQQAQRSDASEDWRNSLHSLETVLELEAQGRQQQEQQQVAQIELAWRTDRNAAVAKNAELQDPNSQLAQEVDRIRKQEPYLDFVPNGYQKAVEIATLLLSSGSDSELREENEKIRSENEQLRAQLEQFQRSSQPARGGPGKPPQGPRRQEDMSAEEEESFLRELASREDAAMRR